MKKSAGSKTASQASNVVKIDSREEQKVVSDSVRAKQTSKKQKEVTQVQKNEKTEQKEIEESAKGTNETIAQQRPRSRPSDKHPIKRGNSSSS